MFRVRTIQRMLAILACAAVLTAGVGLATVPSCAQTSSCTSACQAAYAQCYRESGSNRRVCEAQLQQCLAGCISKR